MKGKTKSSRILIIAGVLIVSGILIAVGCGCSWGGYGGYSWGHKCGHQCGGWGYQCGNNGGCGCQDSCDECQPKLRIESSYGCGGTVIVNQGGQPIAEPERPDCDTITSALSAPSGIDIPEQSGIPSALPIEMPEPISTDDIYGLSAPVLPVLP